MIRARRLAFGLILVTLVGFGRPGPSFAHDGPSAKAAREMAAAAKNLWLALTPEQQQKIRVDFNDPLRHDWHFIPRTRKGIPLKEMTGEQKALAHALLASGMSQGGYMKVETIISLEQVLASIEQGRGANVRDTENYFFNIFGNPDTFAREPWGWRVEGHHLSLNFTIAGDAGVAGGPIFMGSNPAEVRTGPRAGLRVLGEEEDLARKFVESLSSDQRAKAIMPGNAPGDILSLALPKAVPLQASGILMTDLDAGQKEALNAIVVFYAERLRPEISGVQLGRIMKAGVDKIGFAWAGPIERGKPHYYRIQGPTFLIEYDNTQGNANHVHSVWRDFDGDFGEDILKKHYESANADHGHTH